MRVQPKLKKNVVKNEADFSGSSIKKDSFVEVYDLFLTNIAQSNEPETKRNFVDEKEEDEIAQQIKCA